MSLIIHPKMFYEELPAERRAVRRLFQILCDKIREELQVSMLSIFKSTHTKYADLETACIQRRFIRPSSDAPRIRWSQIPSQFRFRL